jgi:poly-gamma-glutamate capsule biosynthesis protein CapA/YwtB (metallophosphatase superfamily)
MRFTATRAARAVFSSCLVLAACASSPSEEARTERSAQVETSTEATPPPTTRAPRRFTLAASGDILLHNNVIQSGKSYAKGNGYEFSPMFDDVRDLIGSADLALCHMETPISADNTKLTVPRTLSFNAPREIAAGLKGAGFDGCDTASNHTYDRQLGGVNETLDVLDAAGLKHSGSSRDQAEADRPPIYEVNGVNVGHLAYSYTIYNDGGPSTTVPAEAPWLRSMLWPALTATGIIEQARALRARGAEFVVVSMHWGDQYVRAPNAQQRQLARDLLSAPEVDLILGDHVHVVQPCEKIGDKYVAYGMGNFLSNQSPTQDSSLRSDNQDGSLDTFTVDETAPGVLKVTKMQFAPTWVEIPGHRIRRATPDTFPDSYNRTVAAMGALGPGACDASPSY